MREIKFIIADAGWWVFGRSYEVALKIKKTVKAVTTEVKSLIKWRKEKKCK